MKNNIIIITLAIFLLGAGLYFLLLSNPNYFRSSDKPGPKEVPPELEAKCFENDNYLVIQQKEQGYQEQEPYIIVKSKEYGEQEIPCAFTRNDDDFLIENNGGSGRAFKLIDNYLFVYYGTSKITRLSIFDLSESTEIYQDISTGAIDFSSKNENSTIQYWRVVSEIEATPENCPEYNQFIADNWHAGFNQLVTLNLKNLAEEIGELVCVKRE